jgi:sugar O-acyltransferase (sialic acid O-acetyltransferase NeuD family)
MNRTERIVLLGAGGHAKVVISTLEAAGRSVAAVLDDDRGKWGQQLLDVPVTGPLSEAEAGGYDFGVVAVGDNVTRKAIAQVLRLLWLSVVHPRAIVHDSVTLGAGTVIFAGAVVQPGAVLGNHVIVNTGATVDHDCVLADFVHVAPGAHLAGHVAVGEGSLIGIGSSVIPGIKIGSWTMVGAGGVVLKDLPDSVLAFGVPARVKRKRS